MPVLKHWGIFELTGLDAAAEERLGRSSVPRISPA
jgi:hypothetical protein